MKEKDKHAIVAYLVYLHSQANDDYDRAVIDVILEILKQY